jgi:lipopolysaccharide/colanic/teichoic acid biosynthesis glycosyltransferase
VKKRAFDVTVISLAAVVWVPVVLVAAAAVLLLSGRPIFYRSRRWVGPGTAIRMLKLRVMVPNAHQVKAPAENGRFLNTPPDSPLYTGIGRVLDRLGINEIPQFVHVLRGQMSIVGARPLTDDVREALLEQHALVDERWLSTPAGLTGLPQLVGRMGLTDAQRLQLEAAYSRAVAHGYTFTRDFKILLYTVLITFGLKKQLSYEEALQMVQRTQTRRERVRQIATQQYAPAPTADADVA